MPISEAQKRGNEKYQKSKCMRISLIINKNVGDKLMNHINKIGDSKNGFIFQAIKEKIERDTGKSFDEFLKEQQELQELQRSSPDPAAISPAPAAPDEPAKPPEVNKGNQ